MKILCDAGVGGGGAAFAGAGGAVNEIGFVGLTNCAHTERDERFILFAVAGREKGEGGAYLADGELGRGGLVERVVEPAEAGHLCVDGERVELIERMGGLNLV